MTSPADQLANLSIAGRMASRSRQEAQRERRQREAQEKQRRQLEGQASGSTQRDNQADYSAFRATSGLRYNIQSLPAAYKSAAVRGLQAANIDAEKAKMQTTAPTGPYTVLQMTERLRLKIHASPQSGRRVDCSCEQFVSNKPGICCHIYWLYDRVNATQSGSTAATVRPATIPDVESVLAQILKQSAGDLEDLTEAITPFWVRPDEDTDHEIESLLSIFDPKRLPDEFDEDFYASLPQLETHNLGDLVEPDNLFRTIFSLARYDHVFRERLTAAIAQEKPVMDLLHKLDERQKACFKQFKHYAKEGPRLNPDQVAESCKYLQDIVTKLSDYRQLMLESPNEVFDRECARIAIKILKGICKWNRDIYGKSSWLRTEPPAARTDRNLFIAFFHDTYQSAEANGLTKLLCIELPIQAVTGWRSVAAEIVNKLRTLTAPVPPPLMQTLESFLQRLRSEPVAPLSVIENYQSSSSSSARSSRANSTSSGSGDNSAEEAHASGSARRPASALAKPEAQRRRLQ